MIFRLPLTFISTSCVLNPIHAVDYIYISSSSLHLFHSLLRLMINHILSTHLDERQTASRAMSFGATRLIPFSPHLAETLPPSFIQFLISLLLGVSPVWKSKEKRGETNEYMQIALCAAVLVSLLYNPHHRSWGSPRAL